MSTGVSHVANPQLHATRPRLGSGNVLMGMFTFSDKEEQLLY